MLLVITDKGVEYKDQRRDLKQRKDRVVSKKSQEMEFCSYLAREI
jgi:hypothetical protein